AITCSVGSLSAGNYTFNFAAGTLTVNRATLTVTADGQSRGYGASNPTFTATIAGFKNGETLATSGVTGAASCASTATASSPVGTFAISCALGSLAAGNYTFSFVNGTLTVSKATLSVIADDKSRQYGEPNPALSASYSGFKNGQILATSDVTGSPSLATAAGNTSAVGPYAITAALGTLAS